MCHAGHVGSGTLHPGPFRADVRSVGPETLTFEACLALQRAQADWVLKCAMLEDMLDIVDMEQKREAGKVELKVRRHLDHGTG